MKETIRILLVDDQELVRHGLRRMLESEENMEVVGDYANADEALSQIAKLCPDVVLMDSQMPSMDGIEATRHLKGNELYCDADVIILADSTHYQAEALQAGAVGYLIKKDIKCAELNQYIRQIYWSKQLPEGSEGFVEESVELVVPPPADAAQLLRFICQLEERLHDKYDDYASIMHTVGSWDRGTVITILLKPDRLSSLQDKLGNMPEVEQVDEEPLASGASSSFPEKFGVLPRPSIIPSKRLRVTLKETGIQELATVSS